MTRLFPVIDILGRPMSAAGLTVFTFPYSVFLRYLRFLLFKTFFVS
jgi:hypothetical protein